MTLQELNKYLGNIDLYLLDQILKNKIPAGAKILDAGCGEGRNLLYFLNNNFDVKGIDQNPDAIRMLQFIVKSGYPSCSADHFTVGELTELPYQPSQFDYVICSAVLHFAKSKEHFWQMFASLDRVLASKGSIFIRMTTDVGTDGHVNLANDLHQLGDGSRRFLITIEMIQTILDDYGYTKSEPIKSVVVEEQRSMITLVLTKN